MLILCKALGDDRLNVQVRNNTIGVRDFRIDAERLRRRLESMLDPDDSGNGDEIPSNISNRSTVPQKRIRLSEHEGAFLNDCVVIISGRRCVYN